MMSEKINSVCPSNQCAGCMACVDGYPRKAITIVDAKKYMNAVIDENQCIHCNACHRICQRNHPASFREPKKWLQGWGEDKIRASSSSGGFSQALMRAAVKNGFSVAACRFHEGNFDFDLFDEEERVNDFIGSKYVKSNPIGIYKRVRTKLNQGRKVLFIGLPCQVSSLRNFNQNHKNLYTVDLVCHGTPSVQLLRESIKGYGYDLSDLNAIYFRKHDRFAIKGEPVHILPEGVQDCYTRAFLRGLCYTENWYSCQYARPERVGDLTMGDSWGTEMKEELHKGLSLVLCQTAKGQELLDMMDFKFFPVDKENSIRMNHQLCHPSAMPMQRKDFFKHLEQGISFNHAVGLAYPKDYFKQYVKRILIGLKLYQGGVNNSLYTISLYIRQ